MGIGEVAVAGDVDMALTASDHEISGSVDLPTLTALKNGHQTLSRHGLGRINATRLAECWREIHEVDEVVNDSSGFDVTWPTCSECNLATDIVEVAFCSRHSGNSVIAADNK